MTTTADPDVQSFAPRLNIWAMLRSLLNNNVAFLTGSGAPVNGTSGTGAGSAAPSSLYFDFLNGAVYYNNGTLASPTWDIFSLEDVTGDVTISGGVSTIGAGKVTPTKVGIAVINKSGSSIPTDSLVTFVDGDATTGLPRIVLANAATAGHDEIFVTIGAIANNAQGVVYEGSLSAANLNTNAASGAGAEVYLSDSTPGAFTVTAPTAAGSRVIPVGIVQVKSATVGQILWNAQPVSSWGTNDIQANAITVAKLDPTLIQVATGSISSANITGTGVGQLGHANGVVLIAGQGATKIVQFIGLLLENDFSVAAYTGGGTIGVKLDSGGVAVSDVVAVGFTTSGSDTSTWIEGPPSLTVASIYPLNKGLNLVSSAAPTQPGTAAGVFKWTLYYRILTTQLD